LDNYDNCLRFLTLISHPKGKGLGLRHITLSTCGLVPQIKKLAGEALPVTLAVSLHAADDGIRRLLMPIARKYSIKELIDACAVYARAANRRITYEYALINGLNDTDAQARALAALLKGHLCHVNLLPVNAVSNEFAPSTRLRTFSKILTGHGITATVRRSMGSDINAACGQLRRRHMKNGKERL
jgi:23S rRNA (adenine2503-C2)-methyltransferase